MASVGGTYQASAFKVHTLPCKVEAELFATRGRGARKPLAEEETPLASGTLWYSRGVKPLKMGVFKGFVCLKGLKPTAKTAQNH